jgi:hypothetical protein
MPRYDAAHLNKQGQDMIIFPLDDSFDYKSEQDQYAILEELELRAHAAGLAGTAVAVWESGGRTKFIAPTPWHPFFRNFGVSDVLNNINVEISW